ncbi:MAG: Gfo/Idh/MocA family protein [Thermoguttaceae bacterium]
MNRLSRRQLLKLGTVGVAGAMAAPYLIPAGVLAAGGTPGANQRIGIGAIGVGGRASLLLDQLPKDGRIVALSDCNIPRAEAFKAKRKGAWPVIQDYRKLLERKDIDAVIIATQEFQRVVPSIHACQAGKDVYAEKPLTLYVREGRVLVDFVRKTGRVFQVGSQQRSMAMNRIACELVRTGGLGKIIEVLAPCYPGSGESTLDVGPAEKVPAGLDWDVWLNQAAWRPFNGRWGGGGRDFNGGEMTNWGAHGVDQIQWGIGADGTGPVEMWPTSPSANGKVEMRYASGIPVRFVLDHGPWGGAIFVCEKGKLEVNRNKFTSNPKHIAVDLLKKVDEAAEEKKWSDQTALWQAQWHMQNWIDCIRTRQKPVADVEIGHRSISVCHLANITRWVGRRLKWDPEKEQFIDDEAANRFVDRPRRKGYELPAPA